MTQYTALFTTVYVFIVMEVSTRRIAHFNVTTNPTMDWVKNQIRDIAAFDRKPRFLLHDNDGIFGQFGRLRDGFRCQLDRWLATTMAIEGLPTPYGDPNANPHIERFHRTLPQDALNHFIFLNAGHVGRVSWPLDSSQPAYGRPCESSVGLHWRGCKLGLVAARWRPAGPVGDTSSHLGPAPST